MHIYMNLALILTRSRLGYSSRATFAATAISLKIQKPSPLS